MSEDAAPQTSRRGPRSQETDLRAQILEAARTEFAENAYAVATVRRIGRTAGVDPKLVHYYFGTKDELFSAAIADAFRSRGIPGLITQVDGDTSIGIRYLRAILIALESDTLGPAFLGLVRNLGTHEDSRRIFLRFIHDEVIGALAPQLPGPVPEARLTLAGSQLLGLVMVRYVLKVPPLATMSIDEVAQAVGPNLDRYLTADLSDAGAVPSPDVAPSGPGVDAGEPG